MQNISDPKQQNWWENVDVPIGWNEVFKRYAELEYNAKHTLMFTGMVLPGLLQTEQYIANLWQTFPAPRKALITSKEFINFRIQRQWHFFEDKPNPSIQVLTSELALYNQVGSTQVMIEQIQHLTKMVKIDNVQFRIIPFETPQTWLMHMCPISMRIHFFHDHSKLDVLEYETGLGHTFSDNEYELESYKSEYTRAWREAANEIDSVEVLEKALKHYRNIL